MLKEYLKERGITVGKFEKQLGLSSGYFSRATDLSGMSIRTLRRMSELLGLDFNELMEMLGSVKISVKMSKAEFEEYQKAIRSSDLPNKLKEKLLKKG